MNIIGKGGFASEVAAYFNEVQHYIEPAYLGAEGVLDINECKGPALIAIGDPVLKERLHKQYNIELATVNKGISYSPISPGSIICHGVVITVNVELGCCVIVNLNSTIGHDSVIGDYTTISPGANISGNTTIGKRCYIGTNAVIREKIQICDDVVIGAGAVVVKNIVEPGTYVGSPCKKI